MFRRTSNNIPFHTDRWSTAIPAYVLTVFALAGLSFYALEGILGSLIDNLPHEGPVLELSRVEMWERAEAQRPLPIAPAVQAWSVTEASARAPIPPEVVQESEGSAEPVMESGATMLEPSPFPFNKTSTSYRTVCVRLCDGAYFPVSFATTPDRFATDERQCQSRCRSAARLYVYKNPGESPAQMVDRFGNPYSDLASAFAYKSSYAASCSCRSNPWEQLAQDRHRLYALESRTDPDDRGRREEIAVLRETIAAREPVALARVESVTRTQHFASAQSGVLDAAGPPAPVTANPSVDEAEAPPAGNKARSPGAEQPEVTSQTDIAHESAFLPRKQARVARSRPRIPIAAGPRVKYRRYAANSPGELVRRALGNGF